MTAAPLTLEELTSIGELERLRPEWSALAGRCPWTTVFQLPEWQLPWWRHLGGGELRAIALRLGGRLVGFAPLFVHGFPWQPRELSLLATGVSDYEDFLLEPEIAASGVNVIFERLTSAGAAWRTCAIQEVRSISPLLEPVLPASLTHQLTPGSSCPVLQLPAAMDELLARLSGRFRRKLRMVRHRLERAGDFRYVLADADTAPDLMSALFRLHQQRWTARNEPGVLADPRLGAFHADVAAGMLAAGMLRLYALQLNGQTAAVFYGFAYAGRMYSYLTGIDPSAGYYSPGTNLLHHVITEAVTEGVGEFDMLRGEEAYKYLWGAVPRQNQRLTLRCIADAAPCAAHEHAGSECS